MDFPPKTSEKRDLRRKAVTMFTTCTTRFYTKTTTKASPPSKASLNASFLPSVRPLSSSKRTNNNKTIRSNGMTLNAFSNSKGKEYSETHKEEARIETIQMMQEEERMFLRIEDVSHVPPGSARPTLTKCFVGFPKQGLVLLVGKSGAGKSTLLHLIAGLSEPTEGGIYILDDDEEEEYEEEEEKEGRGKATTTQMLQTRRSRKTHTPAAERTKKVGLCFQFPERHFLGRTILEELTFGWPQNARSFRMRRELAETTKRALRAVDMQEYPLESEVKTLSGGYKRRLALACQLARDPKVLCLDEPLAGLDWKSRSDVAKVLEKLKRERLIVVVTHDVEEMKRIADFAYRVRDNGKGIEEEIGLAEGGGGVSWFEKGDESIAALKSEFGEFL